ncbi:MAG TPA: AraC family transcriptional regulator ligand-binding domain-containing protein, partial [Paracoccus sp. (in: a-proteobacteria)]|nr:AraC family transcriptional regulator ligand-binding domain-containing protein [Paracoccus sp. (in: a-proteobacteria)]
MDSSWIITAPLDAVRGTAPAAEGDPAAAGATMPLADFVRSLEELADLSGNPMAIWLAGEAMNPAHLGILGCALAAAPALGSALRCFQRFFGTLQSATSAELEIDADMAHFRYRILDQDIWPRRADAELTLGLVAGMVR